MLFSFANTRGRLDRQRRSLAVVRVLAGSALLGVLGLSPGRGVAQPERVNLMANSPPTAETEVVLPGFELDVGQLCSATVATAGRYLLVSSFQCNVAQPGCECINAVLRYDATTGAFSGVQVANIPGPYGMALHPVRNTLLVASRATHTVKEYNLHTGAFLGDLVTAGEEGLHLPQYITFKPDGNLLVNSLQSELNFDKLNGIAEFDGTTGEFVHTFVDGGFIIFDTCERPDVVPLPPCLRGPAGMAWGPNGHLYVVSSINDVVIEYEVDIDGTGAFVDFFDSTKLVSPNGIAVRPAGTVRAGNRLVTSKFDSDKIVEFDSITHELISANGGVFAQGFDSPGPLLWENDAILLVSDRLGWLIFPFYTDLINRHSAATGAFLGYFKELEPPLPPLPLHFNTGMLFVDIGCQTDEDCNDGNPCTSDLCDVDSLCVNVPDDAIVPNDGLFCNGIEDRCENGVIIFQVPPPDCNDGLSCTTDTCNELLDQCENDLQPDTCLIEGVCRALNTINSANGCEDCDPAEGPFAWSPLPAGAPCGDQNNSACNHPDTCDGAGTCRPNFEPVDTPCGDGRDTECSDPDLCNGSGFCQPRHAPDQTPCNDGDPCTLTDQCFSGVCFGAGAPCLGPDLPFCLATGNDFMCVQCLVDTDCEPVSRDCPVDSLPCMRAACLTDTYTCAEFPDDSICADSRFCNGVERCNAITGCCDPGSFPCNPGEVCDEIDDRCIPCLDDADCDDNLFCNGTETCSVDNACFPGTPPDCSHLSDDCNVGDCDAQSDQCVAGPANEGGVCDDDDFCTTSDACSNGICVGGSQRDCGDDNMCTDDFCAGGACQHINNSAPCDDENLCTSDDACSDGTCTGTETICDDGNVCTSDTCDPAGGGCVFTPVPFDPPVTCDDGNVCTNDDRCFAGLCLGVPKSCNDGNLCTFDFCDQSHPEADPKTGCVQDTAAVEGESCDDDDACTTGDVCSNGVCGGQPLDCDDHDVCTDDSCIAGTCEHVPNTAPCDDTNPCTDGDQCAEGTCAGTPVACPPGLVCDPVDGQCRECLDDTFCDDSNGCTNDVCTAGVCEHPPLDAGTACGDLGQTDCDNPDTCDGAGTCQTNNKTSGTPCPGDASECTDDVCNGSGACTHPPLPDNTACADEGNECTNDVCLAGVCEHPPLEAGTACGDAGQADCDNPDTCDGAGTCQTNNKTSGAPCQDDGNECTDDLCDGSGACTHPPLPDNTACTDDGNECTDDVCLAGVCEHPPLDAGTACGDSGQTDCDNPDTCDGAGTCRANNKTSGTPCTEDTNECTDDLCDGSGACTHPLLPDNTACTDDANECTDDVCVNGICEHVEATSCDDGDPCTQDTCDPATGECEHTSRGCRYGDVAPAPDGDCDVTVDDILCVFEAFAQPERCLRGDLFPCGGDGLVTLDDLLGVVQAFEGNPPCPDTCGEP